MATVLHGVSLASTTNGNSYTTASFTPSVGDLLVLFVHPSGTLAPSGAVTDTQGLGWTQITGALSRASGDNSTLWVSNATAAASATTVTFSCPSDSATGCTMDVLRVSGMSRTGASAVRQSQVIENHAAGTPAPAFSSAALTGNPTIGSINNASTPATMTPPTSWTEAADVGYSTPVTGLEVIYRNSGFTGTTITWGSSSATAFSAIIAELDASVPNSPPTITADTNGTVTTYYFDGHISVTDSGSIWTNDANAFDGSTSTFASVTGDTGSTTRLSGIGTTASTSGSATITQVRGRVYGYESADGSSSASWSSYATLTAPSGGWTWGILNGIESRIAHSDGGSFGQPGQIQVNFYTNGVLISGQAFRDGIATGSGQTAFIAKIEIEVTTAASFTTATPSLAFTGSDTQSDDLQYEIQIDTASTFDSQSIAATPALAESVKITNATTSPGTATLTGVTTGELITVQTTQPSSTLGIVTGVTDSRSNTYTKYAEIANATGVVHTLWYAYNAAGGNTTVSVAFNAAANNLSAIVRHWTGVLSTTDPADGVVTDSGTSTNPLSSPNVTPSTATSLIVGGVAVGGAPGTITADSPYINGDSIINSGSWSVGTESYVGTSGTAYHADFTIGASQAWAIATAAFKSSSVSAPLLDKLSSTDAGFLDVPNNADTAPFTAGNKVSYTVQSANSLSNGTYYWRVRAIDPSGSNTYSSWTTARSFTVSTGPVGTVITATQPATGRISKSLTKTQPTTGRIASTRTKTEPAIGRIAIIQTKTQTSLARLSRNNTKTQLSIARIARMSTKTQSATANITVNTSVAKTQSATGRIATNRAATQSIVSRISTLRTLTQPGIARISQTYNRMQGATAHIAPNVSKTQPVAARIATNRIKTQPSVSRISTTSSRTQTTVSRLATNRILTQLATARLTGNLTGALTQTAKARLAANRSMTQGGISRIAANRNKPQTSVARLSRTYTLTQPSIARIQKTVTKTQLAVARITTSRSLTQPGIARVAQIFTKPQTGIARIASARSLTQPVAARISRNPSKTQTATARIVNTGMVRTQGAISRIAINRSNTQAVISRISNTRTLTQPGNARIAAAPTKQQPAVSRIAIHSMNAQPGISRIATNRSLTQTEISRISVIRTRTQPIVSRLATIRVKTQSATASTTINGLSSKTQPALSRIAITRATTQTARSRIANRQVFIQISRAFIAATKTKTQPVISRISGRLAKTQPATARIVAVTVIAKTQTATARIVTNRQNRQTATARILSYSGSFTGDSDTKITTWTADTDVLTAVTYTADSGQTSSWNSDTTPNVTYSADVDATGAAWTPDRDVL